MSTKAVVVFLTLIALAKSLEDDSSFKSKKTSDDIRAKNDQYREGSKSDDSEEASEQDDLSMLPGQIRDPMAWIFDIDADEDGSVTVEEITKWILRNDDLANSQEAELQWSLYDTDKDGNVTWKEYQRIFIKKSGFSEEDMKDGENIDSVTSMEYSRFKVADQDESGGLNVEELKTMLFPRHHDHMVDHTVQEFLDELDKDLDGLVSMEEYRNVFRDLFTTTSEDDSDTSNEDFLSFQKEYDTNNDQMFDKEEIEQLLSPRRSKEAAEEAKRLYEHADSNKDDNLTHDEVMQSFQLFLSHIDEDAEENYRKAHDEL